MTSGSMSELASIAGQDGSLVPLRSELAGMCARARDSASGIARDAPN